jgi:hypothetical protein
MEPLPGQLALFADELPDPPTRPALLSWWGFSLDESDAASRRLSCAAYRAACWSVRCGRTCEF